MFQVCQILRQFESRISWKIAEVETVVVLAVAAVAAVAQEQVVEEVLLVLAELVQLLVGELVHQI